MSKRLYVGLAILFMLVGLFAFPSLSFASPRQDTAFTQNMTAAAWSGWREVPPRNGLTPDAPGATVYQGRSYLFVRGTDNRIYQNRLTNTSWSGWSQVPGNGLTPSGPAATVYQGRLYLFVRGTDNAIYRNRLS